MILAALILSIFVIDFVQLQHDRPNDQLGERPWSARHILSDVMVVLCLPFWIAICVLAFDNPGLSQDAPEWGWGSNFHKREGKAA